MSELLTSTNPADGYSAIGSVHVTSSIEITKKIRYAHDAFSSWRQLGVRARIPFVKKLLEAYTSHANEIAQIITQEIGTPIQECTEEIQWDWGYANWFVDHAEEALCPTVTGKTSISLHTAYYEPIGVAAVITPWNLPFDMFIWGVIPTLLAGNTVVYKAAEECILTGQLLETIAHEAGLPKGVLSFIHGGADVGSVLVEGDINLIWFTGSTAVGQSLYNVAARKGIKAVLELGGSNPAIVFDDADVDSAVSSISSKRFMFSGQTCDADKRLLVHASIFDDVVDKLKKRISAMIVGNPTDPKTAIGPLVSKKQLELLSDQVEDARKFGATVFQLPLDKKLVGAYFSPALLTGVTPAMRVWKEEVFGPVLPVVPFATEEEAVRLANETEFGLGAQVFTRDIQKAERVAQQIQAGTIDINGVGHFHPFNPFGGYKKSGIGREHGIEGFRELSQIKVISSPILAKT